MNFLSMQGNPALKKNFFRVFYAESAMIQVFPGE